LLGRWRLLLRHQHASREQEQEASHAEYLPKYHRDRRIRHVSASSAYST